MWLPENATHFDPRFRLKIRVGNNEKETIFLLSDCVSMMVAQNTCDVLMVAHDTCDVLMSLVGFMQCTMHGVCFIQVFFCVLMF
jgi:hypothetical protein